MDQSDVRFKVLEQYYRLKLEGSRKSLDFAKLAKEWGVSRREIEVALIFLVQRGSLNGEFVGGTDVPVVMEITDVGMEDYEVQVAQNKISLGPVNSVSSSPDARNVFVVHGRDKKLRIDLFSFLRSINLNPLEFSEAIRLTGKAAPYIGEVLDAAFRNAQAVIVLLSPDDEARLRPEFQNANDLPYERELTPQPRQNVLFEAGLAFGYKPNRTILVRVGELRPFSDIYGRHEVRLSNEIENRQDLANRLRNAGCEVKTEGTDWHKLGNFESSLGDVEMKLGVNHLVAYYFTHSGSPENPIGERILVNYNNRTAYLMSKDLDGFVLKNKIRWEARYGVECRKWSRDNGLTLSERTPSEKELM